MRHVLRTTKQALYSGYLLFSTFPVALPTRFRHTCEYGYNLLQGGTEKNERQRDGSIQRGAECPIYAHVYMYVFMYVICSVRKEFQGFLVASMLKRKRTKKKKKKKKFLARTLALMEMKERFRHTRT
ncbi:hypothetical protein BX600DRAFT_19244 [Xylariales sp. PMI_506]|nr:hypothetical protein BX600DRAFT_19244 [Xylariales sp. PMI_506]